MIDFIAPVLAFVSAIAASIFAYRGSKDTDSTDRLSKAAGLYSDYADKMEKRVTDIETKYKEIQAEQVEMGKRLSVSEEQAEAYKKEAEDYKKLILEVIQWITELIDWEVREYASPAPRVTLNMVLTHLTKFMQSKDFASLDDENGGSTNAN